MADQALRRADELLTELVELVETARAVPMSSSCVIGREQTLDLLDALRDVMPAEMAEARRVVAQRDDVLRAAAERDALSHSAAEQRSADVQLQADALLAEARINADVLLDQGRAEQMRLISATTVHTVATTEVARLRAEAERYADDLRQQAHLEADRIVAEAVAAATEFRANSESYADRTLADLLDSLGRLARTAEQGRMALAARRAGAADALSADRDQANAPAGSELSPTPVESPAASPESVAEATAPDPESDTSSTE